MEIHRLLVSTWIKDCRIERTEILDSPVHVLFSKFLHWDGNYVFSPYPHDVRIFRKCIRRYFHLDNRARYKKNIEYFREKSKENGGDSNDGN